jgi:hypothetical protein
MPVTQNSQGSLPPPPPDGATYEEIETYLNSIRFTPVAHAEIVLNGYIFFVDLPRPPTPPPTFWTVRACNPPTARDTQRIREQLGYQWCWEYAIDTILSEMFRVSNAVPTPDPGPWPP